ncbi:SusC/RagA family TonB-linked outer membrane protein [Niastella vici]|uniref:SusC/RagA family TonB-linked outer membrane protein n=1 Tax=Niastella vici TaxID=1703345 RepID=A0A1V9FM89_9BACT|nr:SusC/RagA family TonB-linked outer membrane protein [Niastella vici]OQP59452.1 SusC/RagA family TonB-linked outer membrane protein [Niastella vici]
MKKHYKIIVVLWAMLCCCIVSMAQSTIIINPPRSSANDAVAVDTMIDFGFKKELPWRSTGAVYTLSGKALNKMFTGNLLNTLQGRIPGLTVVTGSGEPGYDLPALYVRGQTSWNIGGNQLVILLDGFHVEISALSALSPYEIESVTLLKDAAATAMFGLQGGAGVLSIRTRKGRTAKNELVLNARYGISSVVQLPRVMNGYDYTTLYNQALVNDGFSPKYPNPELYRATNDPIHPNVNWYNELLNSTSHIQDYNLLFRGGNETARYFVMVDYMNNNGLYKNAKTISKDFGTNATYNKINLRANADIDLSKNLLVSAAVSGIIEDRNTPSGFSASQLFNNLMTIPAATFAVKNPNGTWGNSSVYNFNPVELLQQSGIYKAHTRTIQTGVTAKQKLGMITPGLALTAGVSFNNQYGGYYQTSYAVRTYEMVKNAQDMPVRDADSNIVYKTIGNDVPRSTGDGGTTHWNRNTLQFGFDYNRSFGKHTFSGTLLGRRESYLHDGQSYAVRVQGLSAGVTYDYAQKYIVDVSGAYMGSADFAPGKRYGLFPAAGIGWVASNEGILKGNKVVDYLKFRASYGAAANINESYRFLYEAQAGSASGWITGSGNTAQSGLAIAQLANPNATWELKTSFNAGFDIRLLKTLSATVDVFSEKRTGIYEIPSASVPAFTGFNLPWVNSGVVHNKGFEAIINYDNKAGDFTYHISGSAAFARNKIIDKSETAQPFARLYQKGFAINQEKGLAFDGFYQQSDFDASGNLKAGVAASSFTNVKPGDLKYKDLDGNGIINAYDMQPFGYSNVPEITLGLNIGFAWKGFDCSAFAQGVLHRTVNLLSVAYNYTHPFVNNNNITAFSGNSWTPATSATSTTPRLSTLSNPNNDQASNFWLRKGDFIKLRSLQLGYTFSNKGVLQKIGSVRVFVNGTNLFVFNKVDGLEPENLSMGYPLTKVVDFGFNIKF